VDHKVTGRLNPRPETNHTELVCEVDGHIAKQRVLITPTGVTLYTRYTADYFHMTYALKGTTGKRLEKVF
jgi:hypothetical protein